MVTYKEELYTEIRKRLTKLAVFVSLLIVFLLASLFLFIENYQLKYDTQQVLNFFDELDKKGERLLTELNESVIPKYVSNEKKERQFYTDYYQEMNSMGISADLMVITKQGDVTLSVGQASIGLSPYYLKSMCQENGRMTRKIQRDINGMMYVIMCSRVKNSDYYSLLIINSTVFNQMGIEFGTKYVISDNLDNILVKNSSNFVTGHKINHKKLLSPLFLENGNLYLSQVTKINKETTLYTYLMTFPLIYFLLFSLVVTSALLYLLWHQSERLAQGISNKQTKEINQLVAETKRLKEGQSHNISLKTNQEFQFLIDNINNMIEERDKLVQQQLVLERQNFHYERKVLEAQFNPHFIYNTLEAIRVTSHFDPGIADRLILSLNRVLRYSVDFSKEFACLGKDSQIIKDFLEVNKIRFDKFSYDIEIDQELEAFPVPKLFLLPLVENAIKYGMKVRQDLFITIHCYKEDDVIHFEVGDNGPGFKEEQLNRVNYLSEDETHHGLINSYRRLKHSYPNSSMSVCNQKEGAIVKFSVWGIEDDKNSCS